MGVSFKIRRHFNNSIKYADFEENYFLFTTVNPIFPASILAVFQILFSVSCLITAVVYIETLFRHPENAETSVVLGFAVTIFGLQIFLSSCALYAFYSNNPCIILCQTIWQIISPVVFGVLCAVIINKFVFSTLLIGCILIIVTFIAAPICAVDALMVFIYFKSYQLIKFRRRSARRRNGSSTESGSNENVDENSSSNPALLTLSTIPIGKEEYYEDGDLVYVQKRKSKRALLPPKIIPVPLTDPPRRYPPTRTVPIYSVSGRRTTHRSMVAGSYASMRWTQGANFAELIHRAPTGQFVLNLREDVEETHTEA